MQPSGLLKWWWSIACACLWGSLWAQEAGRSLLPQSLWQTLEEAGTLTALRDVLPELPPSDGSVMPEEYYLGPGDILQVQVLAPVVQSHRVVVSATADVLIPRLGLLSVKGKSIAQLRQELQQLVRQRNPAATVDVQLLLPRRVVVTVNGYVRSPGTYILPASLRVSTAVRLAMYGDAAVRTASGRPLQASSAASSVQELQGHEWEYSSVPLLPSFCTRHLVLRFTDGTTREADVERGRALGEVQSDPMLSEGLEIFVPAPPPTGYATVSIGGAVRRPLRIAHRHGDRLSFLLRLAGGIDPQQAQHVALIHLPGRPPERVELDTAGMPTTDPLLAPGTAVIVPERPVAGIIRQGVVRLLGGVVRPGAYVIEPGRTRLKEVIEQAGGLVPAAALAQAYIQRVPPPQALQTDPRMPAEVGLYSRFLYSDLRLEDTVRYMLDMRLQRSLVACDFVALFRDGDLRHNVPLEDGDVIVIPEQERHVYLWGQVRFPGAVPFEAGQTTEWYIQQAGGYGVGADPKRVRVLRGPQRVWLTPKQAGALQPGDEIYVPRILDVPAWAQQQAELQFYTVLVGAVSTLTFVVTTIFNLLRR
ncbi:MAG: SLBB domain-containing protein [Chlorobiota bacterium]